MAVDGVMDRNRRAHSAGEVAVGMGWLEAGSRDPAYRTCGIAAV